MQMMTFVSLIIAAVLAIPVPTDVNGDGVIDGKDLGWEEAPGDASDPLAGVYDPDPIYEASIYEAWVPWSDGDTTKHLRKVWVDGYIFMPMEFDEPEYILAPGTPGEVIGVKGWGYPQSGTSGATRASPVPEPSTLAMGTILCLLWMKRFRSTSGYTPNEKN